MLGMRMVTTGWREADTHGMGGTTTANAEDPRIRTGQMLVDWIKPYDVGEEQNKHRICARSNLISLEFALIFRFDGFLQNHYFLRMKLSYFGNLFRVLPYLHNLLALLGKYIIIDGWNIILFAVNKLMCHFAIYLLNWKRVPAGPYTFQQRSKRNGLLKIKAPIIIWLYLEVVVLQQFNFPNRNSL